MSFRALRPGSTCPYEAAPEEDLLAAAAVWSSARETAVAVLAAQSPGHDHLRGGVRLYSKGLEDERRLYPQDALAA